MRTLHLDSGREMRGGQFQVLHLLAGLGSDATLLARPESPMLSVALQQGIDARPFSLVSLCALARIADIVHAHDARTHAWAAAIPGIKLVVSRRVSFPIGTSFLSRWKYRKASHFIAVSRYVQQSLIEGGVAREHVSVVYDGVELPSSRVEGGTRVIALASQDPMKGRDLVSLAASRCRYPIHFSDDLESDLPTASLFLYVTRSEGLGSAALLAMAHGVPVVASNVGGLPEVVEHGHNGMLTENDPEAIARAVEDVSDRQQDMGLAARHTVEERFLTGHMIDGTTEVYRRMG